MESDYLPPFLTYIASPLLFHPRFYTFLYKRSNTNEALSASLKVHVVLAPNPTSIHFLSIKSIYILLIGIIDQAFEKWN